MNRRDFLKLSGEGFFLIGGMSFLNACSGLERDDLPQVKGEKASIKDLEKDEIEILYLASLAPSGHNTQPWVVRILEPNHWVIGSDKKRWLPSVVPAAAEAPAAPLAPTAAATLTPVPTPTPTPTPEVPPAVVPPPSPGQAEAPRPPDPPAPPPVPPPAVRRGALVDVNDPTVTPPALVQQPALVYPELARLARVEGVVDLKALVDENGNVVEHVLVRSTRPNYRFESEAERHVRGRRYRPARKDGVPVRVWLPIVVNFKLVR